MSHSQMAVYSPSTLHRLRVKISHRQMAVYSVYTYKLVTTSFDTEESHPSLHPPELQAPPNSGPDLSLTPIFEGTEVVRVSFWNKILTFMYISGVVYPHRIEYSRNDSEEYPDIGLLSSLPLHAFIRKWLRHPIEIVSKRIIDDLRVSLINVQTFLDYDTMLRVLEKEGKISILPSTNIIARDARRFRFVDEDQEYEVDCLGTKLCSSISERVVQAWLDVVK